MGEAMVLDLVDAVGFGAALMTLATFAQKRMVPMRSTALAANVLFISYGALGAFYPVPVLHLILLPLNVMRILEQKSREPGA